MAVMLLRTATRREQALKMMFKRRSVEIDMIDEGAGRAAICLSFDRPGAWFRRAIFFEVDSGQETNCFQ